MQALTSASLAARRSFTSKMAKRHCYEHSSCRGSVCKQSSHDQSWVLSKASVTGGSEESKL